MCDGQNVAKEQNEMSKSIHFFMNCVKLMLISAELSKCNEGIGPGGLSLELLMSRTCSALGF